MCRQIFCEVELFEQYGVIPVDYATILSHFSEFKSPKDKVSRLEKSGKLIRLKKGLYLISPAISRRVISRELVANHLYGPSCISFESALSYYGLIPERVYIMKSATPKRKKEYHTPIGDFTYTTVPEKYFSIGLNQKIVGDSYAYILASPEKAICDMIISTSGLRFQSKKAVHEYLMEDLRIDFDAGIDFNPDVIKECSQSGYKKTELRLLYDVLTVMKK